MNIKHFFYASLIVAAATSDASAGAASEFFWRAKEKLYQKMKLQKRIAVSVTRKTTAKVDHFEFKGGGIINATADFSLEQAQKFETLGSISDHFKKVVHRKKEKQVYMIISALGYEARMLMAYKITNKGKLKRIAWSIVWGSFTGLKGYFEFMPLKLGRSEIALFMEMEADKIPLPSVIAPFTLEVVAEKVAYRMREHIEREYRKTFIAQ